MNETARFDLHVHSRYSVDSRVRIAELVEMLGPAGLRGFALTDHNTIAGHDRLKEIQSRYPQYTLVPGVEVSTREGHLLVYGVGGLPPIHQSLADTLDWVSANAGVAVPAHPFRFSHGIGRRAAQAARVPALETMNGHSGEVANARAELIAARRGIGGTGGSDAHDARGVGSAYTEFPEGTRTLGEILDHLRRGQCYGGGRSLSGVERLRLALRTTALRAARAFRPI